MKYFFLLTALLSGGFLEVNAQQTAKAEDTEVWEPVPKVLIPAKTNSDAPSDAIILFDGRNVDQWVSTGNRNQVANWTVADSVLTVKKGAGNIETRELFSDYQLHIEWRIPLNISGSGQERGNSGVFLASTGKGDAGYELQIVDSYHNQTYVNGMAGSIYKQAAPLVNAARKPGEWQSYDVIWIAPTFKDDGSLNTPARVTVLFNGVLIQNNMILWGATLNRGKPVYQKHGACPVKLQAHGDQSEPISYRNIWIRKL
jgi:hypothetical protein